MRYVVDGPRLDNKRAWRVRRCFRKRAYRPLVGCKADLRPHQQKQRTSVEQTRVALERRSMSCLASRALT